MPPEADPCVLVIFGASGDLTARKIIPALYDLSVRGGLPGSTCVLGVSRTKMSDDRWRKELAPSVKEHARNFDQARWRRFAGRIHYQPADATEADAYPGLTRRIEELSKEHGAGGNILFYLAVAPGLHRPIVEALDDSELVTPGRGPRGAPWRRIIVEKPFGVDLESARVLNRILVRVFNEDAIFRIDHYLGKEIVQSVLTLRFANTIFEPIWNYQYIDHVQVTAAEAVGVGHRAAYYDGVGAVRDMIQSHLLQVVSLVAMEPPTSFRAHHIRQEKIKAIDAIEPLPERRLDLFAALGQYDRCDDEPAYHLHEDIDSNSTTETFAAVTLHFDNWRWSGTPFYVRTGKRLAAKRTEVVIQFKQPPARLYEDLGIPGERPANQIIIEIAPRGGVCLRFEGKVPGPGLNLDTVAMDFDYAESFGAEPIEAYGPLILDAMRGDQTLFQHRYEVEGAWRVVEPLIGAGSADLRKKIHANYEPGSWGPAAADQLLAIHGRKWHNPPAR